MPETSNSRFRTGSMPRPANPCPASWRPPWNSCGAEPATAVGGGAGQPGARFRPAAQLRRGRRCRSQRSQPGRLGDHLSCRCRRHGQGRPEGAAGPSPGRSRPPVQDLRGGRRLPAGRHRPGMDDPARRQHEPGRSDAGGAVLPRAGRIASEQIPFAFQYTLDIYWGTGRLHFNSADGYRRYAEKVVAYEQMATVPQKRRAALFATEHEFDRATQLFATQVARPLVAADGPHGLLGGRQGFQLGVVHRGVRRRRNRCARCSRGRAPPARPRSCSPAPTGWRSRPTMPESAPTRARSFARIGAGSARSSRSTGSRPAIWPPTRWSTA